MFWFALLSLSPVLSSCRLHPWSWLRVSSGAALGRPGAAPVPASWPGSRAAMGTCWLGMGRGRPGCEPHRGAGSAAPAARQGSAVGRRRLSGSQVCWAGSWTVAGAGLWRRQGWPQWAMVVPSEPDKLTVLMASAPSPIMASLFSASCLTHHVSRPLLPYPACISLYTHQHLIPCGMAAGCCCLYITVPVLCRAKQKENKLGTVSGWFVKALPQLDQAGVVPAAPEQGPAMQPCSSVAAKVWFCIQSLLDQWGTGPC